MKPYFQLLISRMNHFHSQASSFTSLFLYKPNLRAERLSSRKWIIVGYLPEDDISRIGPLIPNGAAGQHFICLAEHQAFAAELFSVAYPKIYNYELVLNRCMALKRLSGIYRNRSALYLFASLELVIFFIEVAEVTTKSVLDKSLR